VKQGGVLSPVLFCVYVDDLLVRLSKIGVGCFIGRTFIGALAYADDIVLVAPSASALRKMLAVCDEYAEYCMSFNAQKSKCMALLPKLQRFLASQLDSCGFSIGSRPMESVNSYLNLGHLISNKLEDDVDIAISQGQFIGQVNNVLTYFCKLDCFVRYRLFQSFCTSYYGCELWSLRSRKLTDFCHAWNKGVCRIWNLPYNTHCYALPILCECLPVSDEICCCMITKMCNS